jgi:hypothetical protein
VCGYDKDPPFFLFFLFCFLHITFLWWILSYLSFFTFWLKIWHLSFLEVVFSDSPVKVYSISNFFFLQLCSVRGVQVFEFIVSNECCCVSLILPFLCLYDPVYENINILVSIQIPKHLNSIVLKVIRILAIGCLCWAWVNFLVVIRLLRLNCKPVGKDCISLVSYFCYLFSYLI